VDLELHRRAAQVVVVAVQELHPHQVRGRGGGGERVAVPLAGGKAPERVDGVHPPVLRLVGIGRGHHVVLTGVDERAVGDIPEVGVGVHVVTVLVVKAAVDAQFCI